MCEFMNVVRLRYIRRVVSVMSVMSLQIHSQILSRCLIEYSKVSIGYVLQKSIQVLCAKATIL